MIAIGATPIEIVIEDRRLARTLTAHRAVTSIEVVAVFALVPDLLTMIDTTAPSAEAAGIAMTRDRESPTSTDAAVMVDESTVEAPRAAEANHHHRSSPKTSVTAVPSLCSNSLLV